MIGCIAEQLSPLGQHIAVRPPFADMQFVDFGQQKSSGRSDPH